MFYYGYHFWGMHIIWWFVWLVFIIWIFATPYYRTGPRINEETPLDILQRRFASGQITNEEYREKKKVLETDLAK